MKVKIYIKNERFMEFIDELATEMTEMTYGVSAFDDSDPETVELAQNYYNEKYNEIESMANNMILLYSDNDLNK